MHIDQGKLKHYIVRIHFQFRELLNSTQLLLLMFIAVVHKGQSRTGLYYPSLLYIHRISDSHFPKEMNI